MRILGIDPGTTRIGYALIESKHSFPSILEMGIFPTNAHNPNLLVDIGNNMERIIASYTPNKAIIEQLFIGNNRKSIILIAQCLGTILYILKKHNIFLEEYPPTYIKKTLTHHGKSSKKEMETIIKKIYNLTTLPKLDDIVDALGIAYL